MTQTSSLAQQFASTSQKGLIVVGSISEDPDHEIELCEKYQPHLQDAANGKIKESLKFRRPGHDPWKESDLEAAGVKVNEWLNKAQFAASVPPRSAET